MNDTEVSSLSQMEAFLTGSKAMEFAGQCRDEVYAWTERTLVQHQYAGLSREEKGLLRRYLEQMTGLSRAQITRLITSYTDSGRVKAVEYERTKFATRYTRQDVELLAYVDKSQLLVPRVLQTCLDGSACEIWSYGVTASRMDKQPLWISGRGYVT
jgi:hypothetical protein